MKTHARISGCDLDGMQRGKIVQLSKVEAAQSAGVGFCSVIFDWDMHDLVYDQSLFNRPKNSTFGDIIAKVDANSNRFIPWESLPLYLVDFCNSDGSPLAICPRSLLKKVIQKGSDLGFAAHIGSELEFFNLAETSNSIVEKQGSNLKNITPGMFGYSCISSLLQAIILKLVFNLTFGPGAYEVAIKYCDPLTLCDNAHLFKYVAKNVGTKHHIIPSFMAKLYPDIPGCSNHIHISLSSLIEKENAFFDSSAKWNDKVKEIGPGLSPILTHFVAGILAGLPSIQAILAPTINSYKRFVENAFAPLTISYGIEDRASAIRIICPPTCPPESTRIEIRVAGADVNPYLAVAALLACGFHGIENKFDIQEKSQDLFRDLKSAYEEMDKKDSIARIVLGNEFVDHFVATRKHEWILWEKSVTNWEILRYVEVV